MEIGGVTTAARMFDAIVERYPGLEPYRGCLRLAINGTYASLEDAVKPGDELALIPPVAGG